MARLFPSHFVGWPQCGLSDAPAALPQTPAPISTRRPRARPRGSATTAEEAERPTGCIPRQDPPLGSTAAATNPISRVWCTSRVLWPQRCGSVRPAHNRADGSSGELGRRARAPLPLCTLKAKECASHKGKTNAVYLQQ